MKGSRTDTASAILLMIAAIPSLHATLFKGGGMPLIAGPALALYILLQWRRQPASVRILIAITAAVSAVALVIARHPGQLFLAAVGKACFFAAFFSAIGLLRAASDTSTMVRRCGALLLGQPPARRYIILSIGAHIFGLILNVGALTLLGAMIRRSNTLEAASGSEPIRQARERRMCMALMRGFATTSISSPLGTAMAVIVSCMPGLTWLAVAPYCLTTSAGLIAIGWLDDHLRRPRNLPRLAGRQSGEWTPLVQFVGLVVFVTLLSLAVAEWAGSSISGGVMAAAVIVGCGWIAWQHRERGPANALRATGRRLVEQAVPTFTGLRAEIGMLSSAGLLGSLAPAFVAPGTVEGLLAYTGLHGAGVAIALSWLMIVCAQVGINPILAATVIATTVTQPEAFGLSRTMLATTLFSTWGVATMSSPVSATVTVLHSIMKVPPARIAYRWNGPYALAAMAALDLWIWLLAR